MLSIILELNGTVVVATVFVATVFVLNTMQNVICTSILWSIFYLEDISFSNLKVLC